MRFKALTKSKVEAWIELVRKVYLKVFGTETPAPNRVFNFDETPFNPAPAAAKVLVPRNSHSRRIASTYREFMTGVLCVGADGTMQEPALIVEGKLHQINWYPPKDHEHCRVSIACKPKHNMDEEWFARWLRRFSKRLPVETERPVVMFLDNHSSHVAYKNLQLAKELRIEMIGLPSNTTSVFQPLDLHLFQPLKHEFKKLIDE